MIPLAIAGAAFACIVGWVLVAHFKTRLTSVEAMLVRFVVAPAVGWMGYTALAPQRGENVVPVVCLTIVAVAAIVAVVVKRDHPRDKEE
ncbi:MAG TPA: hypothetical protein VFT22_26845 [Kofleriaceae bacterium]|nr:hypothetical protein [Kofleriaceae bacterium]